MFNDLFLIFSLLAFLSVTTLLFVVRIFIRMEELHEWMREQRRPK